MGRAWQRRVGPCSGPCDPNSFSAARSQVVWEEQLTSVSSTGSRTCREVGAASVLSTERRGRWGPGCNDEAAGPAGSAAAEVPAPLVSAMERALLAVGAI